MEGRIPRHKPAKMVKFGGSEARRVLPGCVVHRGVDFGCENERVWERSDGDFQLDRRSLCVRLPVLSVKRATARASP